MRLFYSAASPYARKVRAVVVEKGLTDRVELVASNPLSEINDLKLINPLGKIPALVLEDNRVLIDSPVICEYLDLLGRGPNLIPASGDERFHVLTRQATADGIMDAAFNLVMEHRRPAGEQSSAWIRRWTEAILRTIQSLAPSQSKYSFDLGDIAVACALGYLNFRLPEIDWRKDAPELAAWEANVKTRPSLVKTAPDVG